MKKFILFLILALAITLTILVLKINFFAKIFIEKHVSKFFKAPVYIESVDVNLKQGELSISNISTTLFDASKINVGVKISSLLKQDLIVNYIYVDHSTVNLEVDGKSKNFLGFIKKEDKLKKKNNDDKRVIITDFKAQDIIVNFKALGLFKTKAKIPLIQLHNVGKDTSLDKEAVMDVILNSIYSSALSEKSHIQGDVINKIKNLFE